MRDEVLSWSARKPREGTRKIGILDDVEYFGPQAANAFLKALEEPPPGTYWILLTSDLSNTLSTVRSRCQVLGFRPLAVEALRSVINDRLQEPIAAALAERGDDAVLPGGDEREFALRSASGSPGRFLETLCDNLFPARELLLGQLCGTAAISPVEAADTLHQALARESDENRDAFRERMKRTIGVAQSLARDVHAALLGSTVFVNDDRSEALWRVAEVADAEAIVRLGDVLADLQEAVERNGNVKIIAANMMLGLHGVSRRHR